MQLKTILNRVQKYSSFVYTDARFVEGDPVGLEIDIRHRVGSRAACSGCGTRGATYDTLPSRRFQFVPLWGMLVFFVYAMRRVDCSRCGVKVEQVPWAEGKSPITTSYAWFLSGWAKRMSETLETFFRGFGFCRTFRLVYLCSDMWKPYLNVIAHWAPRAVHVLDRYHIVAKLNKAIDEVRAEEAKQMARTVRSHRELILNWFEAEGTISAGIVEGLNNKLKVTFRRAYGYKQFKTTEIALYHSLGKLPEPEFAHRFF